MLNFKWALRWYAVALVVIVLDLWSKSIISANFAHEGDSQYITSFFSLSLHFNHGAAFSFLSDAGGWQRWLFTVIAGGVSLGLGYWLAKLDKSRWIEALALSMVLGGALGNLYDRITLGYVVDFLLFHWKANYFPAFNLADAAICGGAGLLLLDAMTSKKGPEANKISEAEHSD